MDLERVVAYHCGPVLSALKPSNIITCRKTNFENIGYQISDLRQKLKSKNVILDVLYECEKYVLIMIYRVKHLYNYFNNDKVLKFLNQYGYGSKLDVKKHINILKSKIAKCGDFPHEIGIFLGYPLADVIGFIDNKGKNSKITGVWKVYDNVAEAINTFNKLNKCREIYIKSFNNKKTVLQLTVVV